MSRLSNGEREFVSNFGQLEPTAAAEQETARAVPPVEEIDARGISSPLHVLRAHRALRAMSPGRELRVVTSAQQTVAEFQALVKYVVAYELVSQQQVGEEYIHVLRKKR